MNAGIFLITHLLIKYIYSFVNYNESLSTKIPCKVVKNDITQRDFFIIKEVFDAGGKRISQIEIFGSLVFDQKAMAASSRMYEALGAIEV